MFEVIDITDNIRSSIGNKHFEMIIYYSEGLWEFHLQRVKKEGGFFGIGGRKKLVDVSGRSTGRDWGTSASQLDILCVVARWLRWHGAQDLFMELAFAMQDMVSGE